MAALKPEYVLLACAGLLAVSFIAFGIVSVSFSLRIRRFEPETWKHFFPPGEPTGPYNPWPYIRAKRFLRAKKHFELADQKCRELGERLLLTEHFSTSRSWCFRSLHSRSSCS
jgi:hypothetical protein